MSVKDIQKQEKSKKASEVHSLRHEEKSAQSISSLSSYIGGLKMAWRRFRDEQKQCNQAISHFEQVRNQYIGRTDQFSREEVKEAEGEIQMWQEKLRQIKINLRSADEKLRTVLGSPQKPRKTKNYALKKVQEPPSDNE